VAHECQEVAKNPTARYMAVQRRAIAEVAARTQTASVVADYLVSAQRWRDKAIRVGLGDPFDGLPERSPELAKVALAEADALKEALIFDPEPDGHWSHYRKRRP
jgi:hypothetical protein